MRDERDWSQSDLAGRLAASGIPTYTNLIAKIENGERAVRIEEAAAIADAFGVSLDDLLGRPSGTDPDLAYLLRTALDTVTHSVRQLSAIDAALSEAFGDLEVLEFDDSTLMADDIETGRDALKIAIGALGHAVTYAHPPGLVRLRDAVIDRAAYTKLQAVLGGIKSDKERSQ